MKNDDREKKAITAIFAILIILVLVAIGAAATYYFVTKYLGASMAKASPEMAQAKIQVESESVQKSPWPAGFQYRRKVTIQNRASESLSDYQVRIELTPSNFDYSKVRDDGYDIRFTAQDGTSLSFYRQTWSKGGTSVFWVKVPSIPAGGSVVIHMYYGNPSASDASDPSSTMLWWDDFDNAGTLSNYEAFYETWSIDAANSVAEDSGTTNNITYFVARTSNADNIYIETRATTGDNDGIGVVARFGSTSSWYGAIITDDSGWSGGNNRFIAKDDPRTGILAGDNVVPVVTNWHTIGLAMYDNTLRMYVDGNLVAETTDTSHTTGRFGLISVYNQPNAEYDYLLVRKYVEPEPMASVSSTEEARPAQDVVFIIYVRNQGGVEVTITDVYIKAPSGVEDHLTREDLSFTEDGVLQPGEVEGIIFAPKAFSIQSGQHYSGRIVCKGGAMANFEVVA